MKNEYLVEEFLIILNGKQKTSWFLKIMILHLGCLILVIHALWIPLFNVLEHQGWISQKIRQS